MVLFAHAAGRLFWLKKKSSILRTQLRARRQTQNITRDLIKLNFVILYLQTKKWQKIKFASNIK